MMAFVEGYDATREIGVEYITSCYGEGDLDIPDSHGNQGSLGDEIRRKDKIR